MGITRRTVLTRALGFALASIPLIGCGGRRRRRKKRKQPEAEVYPEPAEVYPEPAEAYVEEGALVDPWPDYADRPHHWIYYPDEEAYFCDRHQHHWIQEGGRWVHTEEWKRPNYAAPILKASEFEVYKSHAETAAAWPHGSRR